MRIGLILWWTVCVGQAWGWGLWHPLFGVAAVMTTAATVFVSLLWRRVPRGRCVRAGIYVSALVALQLPSVRAAVWSLLVDDTALVRESGLSTAARVVDAALAVGAWLLVRAWLSAGRRRCVPRRLALPWRDAAGLAAVASSLYLLMLGVADWVEGVVAAGFGVTGMSGYPAAPGGFAEFGWAMVTHGLAGAVEEPVYVGLLALMWPRLRLWTFALLAAVSSVARAAMHLYYAAGTTPMAGAVVAVVLWCAAWSSAALALIYWSRMLWPVIFTHGLSNALGFVGGPYDLGGNVLAYAMKATPIIVLAVIGIVALKYADKQNYADQLLAAAVRRGWVRPLNDARGKAESAATADVAVPVVQGGSVGQAER